MSQEIEKNVSDNPILVQLEKTYQRFTRGQRWEHGILILSSLVLLLTGLPQKYRGLRLSQEILASPERVELIQQIHHIAAIILTIEVLYHLGRAIVEMLQRRLPADIFPNWQDVLDFFSMIKYLLFLSKEKPKFGKFNFEQKFTYWFLFFGTGIMVISGFILWFPVLFSRFLPGGVIPAAKFAHSTEAMVGAVFVLIWHFYHVHIERLNLSIFTGRLSSKEMKEFHSLELERIQRKIKGETNEGEDR
jgi:formate dehydrogenase gamma subunit